MEMTRRKFIGKLIETGSLALVGIWAFAKKCTPRRFVRAAKLEKYPGLLKPLDLNEVVKRSKWSG
jgi:hypothetical protein